MLLYNNSVGLPIVVIKFGDYEWTNLILVYSSMQTISNSKISSTFLTYLLSNVYTLLGIRNLNLQKVYFGLKSAITFLCRE